MSIKFSDGHPTGQNWKLQEESIPVALCYAQMFCGRLCML